MKLIELFENWRNRKPVTAVGVYLVAPTFVKVIKPGDWIQTNVRNAANLAIRRSREKETPHHVLTADRVPLEQLEYKGRAQNWAVYHGEVIDDVTVQWVTELKDYGPDNPNEPDWRLVDPPQRSFKKRGLHYSQMPGYRPGDPPPDEEIINDAEGNMHGDANRADWNSWGTHGMGMNGFSRGFSSSPDMPGVLLPGEAEPEEERLEVVKRK